jgi:hypothetical protein
MIARLSSLILTVLLFVDNNTIMANDDYTRNKEYYPEFKEFMVAIQDTGREDKKSKEKKIVYPKLTRVCGKIYEKIKFIPEACVPAGANKSRDVREMVLICIRLRKHVDVSEVYEQFRQYAVGSSEKLYIIANDLGTFGVDSLIAESVRHFALRSSLKQEDRNAADAIRVAAVMLLPENQGAVTGMLKGVKDTRAKSDQSVEPTLAWAMQAVKTFQDKSFVVELPVDINEDDIRGIDPNAPERFTMQNRDGKWFLDTWRHYLKRKYKNAIGRWDKETGGGGREPSDFADYCDRSSRWLVWVYMMDVERDFLLFSNAKGKPPEYVGKESGFYEEDQDTWEPHHGTTDSDEQPHRGLASSSSKKRKSDAALLEAKKSFEKGTSRLGSLMEEVTMSLKAARGPATCPFTTDATGSGLLQAMVDAGRKKIELEQVTMVMSPSTRAVVLGGIEKQISDLGRRYREHLVGQEGTATQTNDIAAAVCESPTIPRRLTHTLGHDEQLEDDQPVVVERRLTLEERRRSLQLEPDSDSDEEGSVHSDDSPGDSRPRK